MFFLLELSISFLFIVFFIKSLLLFIFEFESFFWFIVKFLLSLFLNFEDYIIRLYVVQIFYSVVKFVRDDLSFVIQIFFLNLFLDFVDLKLIVVDPLFFLNLHQLLIQKINLVKKMFIRFLFTLSIGIVSSFHPT